MRCSDLPRGLWFWRVCPAMLLGCALLMGAVLAVPLQAAAASDVTPAAGDATKSHALSRHIARSVARLAAEAEPADESEAAILAAVGQFYRRKDAMPAWGGPAWGGPAWWGPAWWGPAWWGAGESPQRAENVVRAMANAIPENGLVIADYPLGAILDLLAQQAPSEAQQAQADVLITLSVARYAQQVRHGRLDPRAVNEILDYPVRTGDLARAIAFVAAGDGPERLEAFVPAHQHYQNLRNFLKATRATPDWPMVETGSMLQPGTRDARVPALRRRLAVEGLFGFRPHGDDQSLLYDARLAKAVKKFQARHGLEADGLVGAMTQRVLQESRLDRISRIEMNMERWRWMPTDLGHDHVMVNIPDYRLTVVEAGVPVRDMAVVVGTTDRQTPIFSSTLTWLEINPTWTLTERIAKLDLLPELLENPRYLAEQNITMFADWTEDAPEIDARYIDWHRLGEGIRYFRLRQDPGPANPLGRVKFMMANSFSVYLHDTIHPDQFDKTARPFSSGCVRVAEPRWLTSYLLHRSAPSTQVEQDEPFADWETRQIILKRPMPVHLAYFTAFAGEDGVLHMRDDIYGFDGEMARAWTTGANRSGVNLAALH